MNKWLWLVIGVVVGILLVYLFCVINTWRKSMQKPEGPLKPLPMPKDPKDIKDIK